MRAEDIVRDCGVCRRRSLASTGTYSRWNAWLCESCSRKRYSNGKRRRCPRCAGLPHRRTRPACITCNQPYAPEPEVRADPEARRFE